MNKVLPDGKQLIWWHFILLKLKLKCVGYRDFSIQCVVYAGIFSVFNYCCIQPFSGMTHMVGPAVHKNAALKITVSVQTLCTTHCQHSISYAQHFDWNSRHPFCNLMAWQKCPVSHNVHVKLFTLQTRLSLVSTILKCGLILQFYYEEYQYHNHDLLINVNPFTPSLLHSMCWKINCKSCSFFFSHQYVEELASKCTALTQ